MDSRLSRWCDGVIEAGWLAAVIAIPLFFNTHSDRVFEPDKLTLLRSIALLMAAAWLVKFIDQQGWRQFDYLRWRRDASLWRQPFILPVFLLVVVYLVSTLFSVTPHVSWAGSYQRLQGAYTTLAYITIFALIIATMRTRQQARRVVTVAIITSIPVAFYGLLQHFDLDPLPWAGNVTERVAGHMGNAIFIAAYLIMVVPLTLARIIEAFTNILSDEELSFADVIRASIYIFAVAIQLIAIYWSGSRGPWLGLGVGLFAFTLVVLVALRNATADKGRFRLQEAGWALLLVAGGTAALYVPIWLLLNTLSRAGRAASLAGPMTSFVAFVAALGVLVVAIFAMIATRRGWRWLWLSWIFLAVCLGVWLVLFNLPPELTANYANAPVAGNVLTTLNEWRDLPRIGRLGRVLEADEGTGRVRTLIWQGALRLILPHEPLQFPDGRVDTFNLLRPLIGYGPESMYVAYNRYYPPELATLEARNATPDRSHNETFDALVITGLFGFLAWQALYLSVFIYGFRWLGVLRTRFDRNLLIGLWLGMGLLVAAIFSLWRGTEYIGVAFPFGSIGGLVIYLIYYALFARAPATESQPFEADRLLMAALVSAVLVHYIEIHFGIAVAATRLHFFVYLGIMFFAGHLLPQLSQTAMTPAAARPAPGGRKRRRARQVESPATTESWGPVLLMGMMLALIVGILGYEFMTYSLPPGKVIETPADLTAGEIFHQALFINPRRGFADSPFIYLMIVLTWALGGLVSLSEMVKDGTFSFAAASSRLEAGRRQLAAAVLAVMAAAGFGLRFLVEPGAAAGATWLLGRSLLLIWAALCAWASIRLFATGSADNAARTSAGAVAMIGFLFALPVLIAGGWGFGLVIAVTCLFLLYLLWDRNWRVSLLPAAVVGIASLSLGLFYAYLQAILLRASLFFRPIAPVETLPQFRVLEAEQAATFLTLFYLFITLLIVLAAFFLAGRPMARLRTGGTLAGFVSLALVFILCLIAIGRTNTRIVQADVIYKRGKPYDDEAARSRSLEAWDVAIAVYERAIELAPNEDFYYLFLGRAYLERSTITVDAAEQAALLSEAETRLVRAQAINPLNTDHTANLARLNTRWTELSSDPEMRQNRLAAADRYYRDALSLSPQNSVIRNEYARLVHVLQNDCERALAVYDQSVAIDPFYSVTYFARTDTYVACAASQPEEARQAYYDAAVASIQEGLQRDENNVRAWLQAGQVYQELGRYEEALAAYEEARRRNDNQVGAWNIDYLMATLYLALGDRVQAQQLAQQALETAPPEVAAQIQSFLSQFSTN